MEHKRGCTMSEKVHHSGENRFNWLPSLKLFHWEFNILQDGHAKERTSKKYQGTGSQEKHKELLWKCVCVVERYAVKLLVYSVKLSAQIPLTRFKKKTFLPISAQELLELWAPMVQFKGFTRKQGC